MYFSLSIVRKLCFSLNISRNFATECNPYSVLKILSRKPVDENVKIMGWVKSQRKQRGLNFLHVDDGSTLNMLQVVVPKNVYSQTIAYHACVCVEGKVVKSPKEKQDIELVADKLEVISPGAPEDYPFTAKGIYLEEDVRLMPHFRPRTKNFAALLRARSEAKAAIRKYFENENFINIDTPILTTNDCEGGCETFTVRGHGDIFAYDDETEVHEGAFGQDVYLSVSGQLHLEAMASGMAKVYNFNPAFRGEIGSRFHLHEFWMVEMEEAFLEKREGFEFLMNRLENLVKFTMDDVMRHDPEDLEYLWNFHKKEELKTLIPEILEKPFVRLKYKEAQKILNENKDKIANFPVGKSSSKINKETEIFLTKYFGNLPVFITDWPAQSKPFYMYTINDDDEDEVALGMDLLLPFVGEVAGGSLREPRFGKLKKKIKTAEEEEKLKWYLDIRKFGYAPSGGFGLGFERFLQFFLGISNINDTIPFPRTKGRCLC
ncbi:UNVERIFIED_CONTAM: hypothetical protein RMT77_008126 [Armadillidium vulgare]